MSAQDLAALLQQKRDGYWHFEQVHEIVLRREYACTQCHSRQLPMRTLEDRTAWRAQMETCDHCHLGPEPRR